MDTKMATSTASIESGASQASERSGSVARHSRSKAWLVIADGHPIVLRGLEHLLAAESDFEVLAGCTTAPQALDAVLKHDPDVLVLDLRLPPHGGLPLIRELARRNRSTRVVLLTSSVTEDEVMDAVRAGVKGVALKEMAPQLLLECVRRVHRGGSWLETGSIGAVVERMRRHATTLHGLKARLTRRELEILHLVADGFQTREMTARLHITEGTVKIHLHHIYGKLGMNSRLQLALCARGDTRA